MTQPMEKQPYKFRHCIEELKLETYSWPYIFEFSVKSSHGGLLEVWFDSLTLHFYCTGMKVDPVRYVVEEG